MWANFAHLELPNLNYKPKFYESRTSVRKIRISKEKKSKIRKQIDGIRHYLINKGYDPDLPKVDLIPRNKMIFKQKKNGKSSVQIAADYNLSAGTIYSICRRIEFILRKDKSLPDEYKDLIHYKKDE